METIDRAGEDAYCRRIAALNDEARAVGWLSRCDPTLSFKKPELKELLEIWRRVTTDNGLPARAQFTARLLKDHLPHISILEIVDLPAGGEPGEDYVLRYVGTGQSRTTGDATGRTLHASLPASLLPRTLAFVDIIRATKRPVRIVTRVQLSRVDYLCGEVLGFPLAEDRVTPNKILTATYFSPATENGLMAELDRL